MPRMKVAPGSNVFCSYAFTGEDTATVQNRMKLVVAAFSTAGIRAYCNLDDPDVADFSTAKQYIDHALGVLKGMDVVCVIMTSERRSEGMLMEIGAAYAAGKPIILARHVSASGRTYIDTLATTVFDWSTEDELLTGIQALV